jgi:hypothetical protein
MIMKTTPYSDADSLIVQIREDTDDQICTFVALNEQFFIKALTRGHPCLCTSCFPALGHSCQPP